MECSHILLGVLMFVVGVVVGRVWPNSGDGGGDDDWGVLDPNAALVRNPRVTDGK